MGTSQPLSALRRALAHLSSRALDLSATDLADDVPRSETGTPSADPLDTAISLCLHDDWAEGRDVLRRLAAQHGRCARIWRVLGLAHGRLGDWRRAHEALERSQHLDPGDATAELLQEVRAVRRWARSVERRPWDVEARVRLAMLLMAWERGDEALEHLRRAVVLKPDWAPAHLYLGLELHYRGDLEEAEQAYEEALRLVPDDETASRYLAALRSGTLPLEDGQKGQADPWQTALAG
ncbi:MAG TPA: tetratricopeptide repeat protein [Chloroflexota bacterium]|nr:tetratricopeptide repeat protein [Chloroflexota bacterium]